jgi:hypothetical protein
VKEKEDADCEQSVKTSDRGRTMERVFEAQLKGLTPVVIS